MDERLDGQTDNQTFRWTVGYRSLISSFYMRSSLHCTWYSLHPRAVVLNLWSADHKWSAAMCLARPNRYL